MVYDEVTENPPYIKEIHSYMLEAERVACRKKGAVGYDGYRDLENFERIYDRICEQFGKEAEVWLEYIDFLKQHKPEKEPLVYQRATEKLEGIQLVHFKHKCGVYNMEV